MTWLSGVPAPGAFGVRRIWMTRTRKRGTQARENSSRETPFTAALNPPGPCADLTDAPCDHRGMTVVVSR